MDFRKSGDLMEIPELLGNICCIGILLIFRCKILQRKTRLTYFFCGFVYNNIVEYFLHQKKTK